MSLAITITNSPLIVPGGLAKVRFVEKGACRTDAILAFKGMEPSLIGFRVADNHDLKAEYSLPAKGLQKCSIQVLSYIFDTKLLNRTYDLEMYINGKLVATAKGALGKEDDNGIAVFQLDVQ